MKKQTTINKLLSIFLAMVMIISTISFNNIYANASYSGTIELGDIRSLGVIGTQKKNPTSYRPGINSDSSAGTTKKAWHYGEYNGFPIFCVEAGVHIAWTHKFSGTINNKKLQAFYAWYEKQSDVYRASGQAITWKILDQVNLNSKQQAIYDRFLNEYNANPNDYKFKGVTIYSLTPTKNAGNQRMLTYKYEPVIPKNLRLHKESANKPLTDIIKSRYSIEGATYGVYNTKSNALSNTNKIQTLRTNSNGDTNSIVLPEGEYWVKELTAPKGFLLDEVAHKVNLKGKNQVLRVTDKPKFYNINIVLKKEDKDGNVLPNAKFKIEYFAEENLTVRQAQQKQAFRTWLYKTNTQGKIQVSETLSGSDKLFRDNNGNPVYPLGTILITETKASIVNGVKYKIADPVVIHIKNKEINSTSNIYNVPTIVDKEKPAEFTLTKTIKSDSNLTNIRPDIYKLAGTQFEIKHKISGKKYTLTIGRNGKAPKINLNKEGKWELREISVPNGFKLSEEIKTININKLGKEYSFTFANEPIFDRPDLLLKKLSKSSNKPLANAEFEIKYFAEDNLSIEQMKTKEATNTLKYKTKADGTINASDTPILGNAYKDSKNRVVFLPGSYLIKETKAPVGYHLSNELKASYISSDRLNSNTSQWIFKNSTDKNWKNKEKPVDFKVKKEVKASSELTNIRADLYKLAGTEFEVKHTQSGAKHTLTIGSNNESNTVKLDKMGEWTVKEIKATPGFELNTEVKTFIAEANGVYEVTFKNKPIFDNPDLLLTKKSNITKKTLANAEFEIKYFAEDNLSIEQMKNKEATNTLKYKTKEDGTINASDTPIMGTAYKDSENKVVFLPGSYLITETKAPVGYKLNTVEKTMYIGINSKVKESEWVSQSIENEPLRIDIPLLKIDPFTSDLMTRKSFKGKEFDLIFVSSTLDPNHKAGEVLQTKSLDKNNKLTFTDITEGIYDIVEKTTVKGYELNQIATRIQVGVKQDSNELEMKQLTWTSNAMYDLYDKKIDELNTLNKINTNEQKPYYKEISHATRFTLESAHEKLKGNDNAILFPNMPIYGRISITKHFESVNENEATLSGEREKESDITFDILRDGKVVDTIITDKNGRASSKWLPYGTYTVHQKTKKQNYFNVEDFKVNITKSWAEYQYNLENYPNPKILKIVKKDAETGKEIGQAGVTFKLLNSKKEVIKQKIRYPEIKELEVFTTIKDGSVTLPEKIMPGTYYLREVKAPQGYYLNSDKEDIEVNIYDDEVKIIIAEVENTPQKGKLTLHKKAKVLVGTNKVNIEEKEVTQLVFEEGYLANTTWVLKAKENIISKDGKTKLYNAGDLVDTLITTSEGEVTSKELPLGKYTLEETKTPKEYVRDTQVYDIEFTPQEQNVRVDSLVEEKVNERKSLTFEFTKEFEGSKHFDRDMNAVFGLYNKDDISENGITIPKDTLLDVIKIEITEEIEYKDVEKEVTEEVDKEVVVKEPTKEFELRVVEEKKVEDQTIKETKERFIFTTEEDFEIKKAELSNSNINFEEEIKKIPGETKVVKETVTKKVMEKVPVKTTYFANGRFEDIKVDGNFYIKELQTSKGYVLDDTKHEEGFNFEDTNSKVNTITKVNPIKNNIERVEIQVVKVEEGSNNEIKLPNAKFRLVAVDETLGESIVGEYITDQQGLIVIEGLEAGGVKYYLQEVEAPNGYFRNLDKIEINTTKGQLVDNITVENEKVPEISTKAGELLNGEQIVNPLKKVIFKDKAEYKDLIVGKEYEIKGSLMDKETNKPVLREDGSIITSTLKFIPETRNGFVELLFEVDANLLRGKEVVVFEDLYKNGKLLYSHADINDKEQTITITNPEIKTTFTDINKQKEVLPIGKITFVDVVEYTNLVPNEEYIMSLTVMDKETNKPLIVNGEKVFTNYKFTPQEQHGDVRVEVEIDTSLVKGKTLVAFEKLYNRGQIIATHEDINDLGQTVRITEPKIKTKFAEVDTNSKEVHKTKVKLVDNVSYEDLIVGKEYTLELTIMNKETNKPLLVNKKEVKVTHKFIATQSTGVEKVEVEIDLTGIITKEIVAFEKLLNNKIEIATHEDINDVDQTITVKEPKIKTKFAEVDTNSKEVHKTKVKLVDNVSYEDLIVGKEYTLELTIMNKETNKPLLVNKKEVRATHKFIATQSTGIEKVEVEIDLTGIISKEIVAFEKLLNNKIEIATHEDINDVDQTIKLKEPKIKTSAKFENESKKQVVSKNMTIIDIVEYKDLIVGKEYVISGKLMNKTTGKDFIDGNGNKITSTLKFKPKTQDGKVELTFTFNGSNFVGDLVVFEDLIYSDTLIATHSDINDLGQTVTIEDNPKTVEDNPQTGDIGIEAQIVLFVLAGISALVIFSKKRKYNN